MRWFKDGLNEDQLKKEYRRLAKEHHPDLCQDPSARAEAEEAMKEINHQFDEYFTNQRVREFSWMDTWKAQQAAQKIRATILVWLRKDQENPGKWFSVVERRHIGFWFWSFFTNIKGVTDDGPEWKDFHGGFAYCSYIDDTEDHEVKLSKLPATITPANGREVYYYNRDHFDDGSFDQYVEIKCRFGIYWAEKVDKGYLFYVKAELPKEFLMIGKSDGRDEEYAARSINKVFVNSRWIQEAEILQTCTGSDLPYIVFQECTMEDFMRYHDVNQAPQYSDLVGVKEVKNDFWFISDPVVAYYARKGIIRIFESSRNFRIRFGYFSNADLRKKIHLMSIDDAETIQDYLDEINAQFDVHVCSLIKKGKIKLKI